MRCGGQLRAVPGAVLGYDMASVMAMADGLGVPREVVAEFMPLIERAVVGAMNDAAQSAMEDARGRT